MGLLLLIAVLAATAGMASDALPVPRFTVADRRAKLNAALPEVEKAFEDWWRKRGTPGMVYGIVIDGDLAAVKTFGVREQDARQAVTPDTVFRIASMTKSFTAVAVLKLRDEGKLSLEDPVHRWIPEFARMQYPTRDTAPIKVRQLLTHGAGFPEDNPWGDRQLAIADDTLTRWLGDGIPFSTPPNTVYEYSNYGFALAGRVIEKASGRPYREYVEKEILAPLKMTASTLEPNAVPSNVRAMGYRRDGAGYAEEPSLAHGAFGAMGGMLTSARDLGKYVAYMLSAFPPRDDAESGPVRRSSLREMQSMWRWNGLNTKPPSASGYGYGLGISSDERFEHKVGHGGGLPGFGSYMLWLPEHGVGVFAMANLTYAAPRPACEQALEILSKTGALVPRKWPASAALTSARESVLKLWRGWDDGLAGEIAADNLFLDTPAETRRYQVEQIKAKVGECKPEADFNVTNLLRGNFRMMCDRGNVRVSFTLAPTKPPKIQHLSFQPEKK